MPLPVGELCRDSALLECDSALLSLLQTLPVGELCRDSALPECDSALLSLLQTLTVSSPMEHVAVT